MEFKKPTLRLRVQLFWSKARRMFLNTFRPGYVSASLAKRRGECERCGACCQMSWRCRFLGEENGLATCSLYGGSRLPNCSSFPIDARDLADRDLVSPDIACGYSWDHVGQTK